MPVRVLLVEDNRPDAALVREALKRHGIEAAIQAIEDAETAAAHLSHIGSGLNLPCPAIVIMDLNLPRGDGLELLRHIRQHPECGNVPVIVMTSSDSPKDREAAIGLGNTRYFRKPSDLEGFLRIGALVREVLEESPDLQSNG